MTYISQPLFLEKNFFKMLLCERHNPSAVKYTIKALQGQVKNLGSWDEFQYETCPRCRINCSFDTICSPPLCYGCPLPTIRIHKCSQLFPKYRAYRWRCCCCCFIIVNYLPAIPSVPAIHQHPSTWGVIRKPPSEITHPSIYHYISPCFVGGRITYTLNIYLPAFPLLLRFYGHIYAIHQVRAWLVS